MINKKCSIVIVLAILEAESEYSNPLPQTELAKIVTDSGCPCDRKTVGRDIKALQEMGYPIKKTNRGYYMERKVITASEARLVCACVESADADVIDKKEFLPRLRFALNHKYYL